MTSVVAVQRAGKRYVKYDDAPTLITGLRQLAKRSRRGRLWALRDVDMDVAQGEAIGVIGRNGAGKSTLLALLAGVTAPTEGSVCVRGRVAPLLRLGVGFHRELTGRENVYVNATMLGMTSRAIERKLDEIIAFAEIADFIDTPIKFYSSGMLVRLGFASAVASEPGLLLVDEVLAVGDIPFQTKSFERMADLRANGTTIVVVSHNLSAIREITDRSLLLDGGAVRAYGDTDDTIAHYLQRLRDEDTGGEHPAVRIVRTSLVDERGEAVSQIHSGDSAIFEMDVAFDRPLSDASFAIAIATESAQLVYAETSPMRSHDAGTRARMRASVRMRLVSGTYVARLGLQWHDGQRRQVLGPELPFTVAGRPLLRGVADLDGSLEIDEIGDAPA